MLKKIFMLACICTILASEICFAIDKNEFALGGVVPNMPYNALVSMYGQPTSKTKGYAQLIHEVVKYGDDVEIGLMGNKIRYVVTTANNGWKTPSGVSVGMSIDEVVKILGRNYDTEKRPSPLDGDRKFFYAKWSGTKYIWSQVSENFMYEAGDTKYFIAVVVNDKKVTAVELNQITPEF